MASRAWFVAAALCAALTACKNLNDAAREDFSQTHTCPLDRVEVRERRDLRPSSFMTTRTPPAEVAADPGRLKMWQDEQDKQRAAANNYGDQVFEVRGCGHQTLMTCHRLSRNANRAFCSSKDYPPGVVKW
jgi:hypothetical protein